MELWLNKIPAYTETEPGLQVSRLHRNTNFIARDRRFRVILCNFTAASASAGNQLTRQRKICRIKIEIFGDHLSPSATKTDFSLTFNKIKAIILVL